VSLNNSVQPIHVPAVGASHLLIRLSHYRLFVFIFTVAATLYVGFDSSKLPPIFTAYARLLPPQTNTSTASALIGQVGGGAVLGSSALTIKNPSDLYASLFYSRSVQDDVIDRFKLAQHYDIDDIDELRKEVGRRTKVEVGKDGIITLAYTDKAAATAASIANGMLSGMYKIAQRLAKSEGGRKTEFYGTLIAEAQMRLTQAIEDLRQIENQTGLTRLKGQEEGSTAALIELRGQIATREIELKKMAITATDQHPEVVRVKEELAGLKQQLHTLFPVPKSLGKAAKNPNPSDPKQKDYTQELFLSYETYSNMRARVEPLRRSVDNYAAVLEQLIKAQALTRVDETRDFSGISILDEAVAPTRKSGPRVYVNAGVGGMAGFLIAVMLALIWDVLFTDPARRARWQGVFRSFARKGR
jgi:tyrosine-protein kinase Etk/Wzc